MHVKVTILGIASRIALRFRDLLFDVQSTASLPIRMMAAALVGVESAASVSVSKYVSD
jgi:hypothetical protein